jgi:hypothetical protein
MPRYFTVEQANEALARIRPLVERILEIRQELLARRPDLEPVLEKLGSNGGSRAVSEATEAFGQLEKLIHQIQELGAEIKDINTGLLDFRAIREGREVYLCWQFGEERISFWHDLDAGFAGRQPLDW